MKKRLFLALLLIGTVPGFLMISATTAHADDHGNGKGQDHDDHDEGHGNDHGKKSDHHHEHTVVVVHNDHYVEHDVYHYDMHAPYNPRYFRGSDYVVLRQHYAGPRNLPPGLRKKYYRTGTLPPGWEQRFQPMPIIVVQQLPAVPVYYQRGYIDGYAVVYDRRTRMIVDAVDLLSAATGH
jgi:hypothetical protein